MKWRELGGKVIDVIAAYTSKLAYDGSGLVKRSRSNYAIAKFANNKTYNCDLNGSQNIAARGIIKLTRRNDRKDFTSKCSGWSLDWIAESVSTRTATINGCPQYAPTLPRGTATRSYA